MRPFTEGCHYLHEHYALSRVRRSLATRRNAAYALVAWLDFLSARRMDWRDAPAPTSGPTATATRRRSRPTPAVPTRPVRLPSACSRSPRFTLTPRSRDGMMATSRSAMACRTPATRTSEPRCRRPFLVAEWRAFVAALGPLPSQREQGDFRPSRDRLVAEVGRTVGLRVEEVVRLTRRHFEAIVPDPRAPFLHYPIVVAGKDGTLLPVAVPAWLVGEIHAYIKGERRRAITRLPRGNADPEALFVQGEGSRTPGRPLSVRRLQQVVEESCLVAGLREVSLRRSHDGKGTREVVRARHSFHDLRHTYAVWTYWAERQAGNSGALAAHPAPAAAPPPRDQLVRSISATSTSSTAPA